MNGTRILPLLVAGLVATPLSAWEQKGPLELSFLPSARPYLGVDVLPMSEKLRQHFGAAPDAGTLVSDVVAGSPAEKAGIKVGDVLVSVDGKEVENAWGVMRALSGHEEGDSVAVELVRDRRKMTVTAVVAERQRELINLGDPDAWGLHGRALTEKELHEALGRARTYFDGPEWQERLKRFRGLEKDLEERTKELERRLEELEKRLDKEAR